MHLIKSHSLKSSIEAFLLALLIGLSYLAIIVLLERVRVFNEDFKGKIEAISYNDQKMISITINNQNYSLGSISERFKGNKNDFLVKKKGEYNYTVITKNGTVLKY